MYTTLLIVLVIGLFFGLMVLVEIGRRIGLNRMRRDPEGAHKGIRGLESAVFGLMGLLIGFTFFGAAQRFDQRRQLIIDEANRISTAHFRVDFLPRDRQQAVRKLFREHVDERIEFFRNLTNESANRESPKTKDIQKRIWQEAVSAAPSPGAHPNVGLLFSSLNEMFEITRTRSLAMMIHPPLVLFMMLIGLSLATALLSGYQMSEAKVLNWIHIVGFAFVLAIVTYVILDMEYPRMGLLRVTSMDQALVELRNSIQ
jgi:hypothetical protein